ncbi:hypothetical protein AAC387_Pa12g1036 [Persea americana]
MHVIKSLRLFATTIYKPFMLGKIYTRLGSVHVVWVLGLVSVQELFSAQMLESEAGTVALAKKLGSVHVVWLLGQVLVQELFSAQMLESEAETVALAKKKDAT